MKVKLNHPDLGWLMFNLDSNSVPQELLYVETEEGHIITEDSPFYPSDTWSQLETFYKNNVEKKTKPAINFSEERLKSIVGTMWKPS